MENARTTPEWEIEVGVRVGVRNRLGEAIAKPVANLHGRVGQRSPRRAPRKDQKSEAPVSSKATGLFPPTSLNRFADSSVWMHGSAIEQCSKHCPRFFTMRWNKRMRVSFDRNENDDGK